MRALVTGGTGFVGGAIVQELLKRGHQVRVLARKASNTSALRELGVEIAVGDILDRASIAAALQGCDTLFHAAAIYELWGPDPGLLMQTEVEGTRNALEAALEAGVNRVVYTSTAVTVGERKSETGTETTPHRGYFLTAYERAKYEAEQEVKRRRGGLNLVIIKPAAVIGPGDLKPTGQFVVNLLNGRIPALFRGALTVVDVADAAAAHVNAVERERFGEEYIVAARVLSTSDLSGLVSELAGARKPPNLPVFAARLFSKFEEWKARRTQQPPLLARDTLELIAHGFRVDGSKAARELGLAYKPPEDSLRRAIQWYWQRGLLKRKPACGDMNAAHP